MGSAGLWPRVFVGLLFAVLGPVLVGLAVVYVADPLFSEAEPWAVALSVVGAVIAWSAILGIVYARVLAEDVRSFRAIAERGDRAEVADLGGQYERIVGALDERNRQVATLARGAGSIPIDAEPGQVAAALVGLVRSVMNDPTWTCAILTTEDPSLLPSGVHGGAEDATGGTAPGELERWASVALADAGTAAARLEGPWGAFFAVEVRVSERLSGILLAPWEGRADPTPAELAFVTLVGQNVGTALEHSVLYSRVRAQTDELNRLAAVQADFLRGVTHDLQTPLTSIGALATELRANDSVPASARTDLDTITHQAERLRRMVSQLLVASRLEAGAFQPQVDVFAVRPLVERTWAALRADRPFSLVEDGTAHLAVGDPDRLEQVLWAVMDNAVKYSPEGSPVEVRIAAEADRIAVSVRDHGTGMETDVAAQAFDQFYRGQQARRMAPDGSGVGLFAARGIVRAMGGEMVVASQLGDGTTMTIELPAEHAEAEADGSAPAS